MVIQRENYLTEYENIKANPGYYSYAPPATDVEDDTEEVLDDEVNTVVVSGKDGEQSLVVGNRYYVGQGIDFDTAKAVDEPLLISEFQVLGKNDDGSVQIKDNNGVVKDISPDALLKLQAGDIASLQNDPAASYYFENRNKVFEFNFPDTQGGVRKGRLQYDGTRMYFIYRDSNGTPLRKQVTGKFFKNKILTPVGVVSDNQQRATQEYLSDENLARESESLASSREF